MTLATLRRLLLPALPAAAMWFCAAVPDTVPAEERATPEQCEALYEHVLELARTETEAGLAEIVDRASPEDLEEGKRAFLADCARIRESAVLCMQGAIEIEELERCNEDHMPELYVGMLRAETLMRLNRLRSAFSIRDASSKGFRSCPATPAEIPGRGGIPIRELHADCLQDDGLWLVSGERLFCRYRVELIPAREGGQESFEATAECDLDGDGVLATYRVTDAQPAAPITGLDVY